MPEAWWDMGWFTQEIVPYADVQSGFCGLFPVG